MTGSTVPDEAAARVAAPPASPVPHHHHHHHHHRTSSADPANAAVPVLSTVTAHVHPLLIMIAAAMLALAASLVLLVFRHVAALVRAVASPNPNYAMVTDDDDGVAGAEAARGGKEKGRPVGARGSPRARGTTRGTTTSAGGRAQRPDPTGDRGWPLDSSSKAKRPVLPIARSGSDEDSDDHGPWKVLCDGGSEPNTAHAPATVVLPGGWWPSATPFPMHVDHHGAPDPAVPAAPPAPPELLATRSSPSAPVISRTSAPVATARPPDLVSTTLAKTGRTPPVQPPQAPDPGRTAAAAARTPPPPGPAPAARADAGETRRDVKPPPVAPRPTSAPAAVPVPTKPTGGKRRSRGKAGRAHKPPQIVPPVVVGAAPTPTPTPTLTPTPTPPPAVQAAPALPVAAKTTTAMTTTPVAAMTREQQPQSQASNTAPDHSASPPVPDVRQALELRTPLVEDLAVASPSVPAAARMDQDALARVESAPVPAPVPTPVSVPAAPSGRVRPSRARAMADVAPVKERVTACDATIASSTPAKVPGMPAADVVHDTAPVDPRLRPTAHRTPPRADLEPFPSLAPSPSPPPPQPQPQPAERAPAPAPAPLRVDRALVTGDVRTARAATVPTTPTVAEQSPVVPGPVPRPTNATAMATATRPSPPAPAAAPGVAAVVSPVVPAGTTAAAAAAALRGRSQSWSPFSGLDLDQPVRFLLGGNTHDPAVATAAVTAAAATSHDWYAPPHHPYHDEYMHDASYHNPATASAAPFGYDPHQQHHDAYAAFRPHDPYTAYLPAPAPDTAAAAAAQRMLQAMVDHQRRFHAAAAAAAAAVGSPGVEYAGGKPRVSPLLVEGGGYGGGYAGVDLAQHVPGEVFARAHLAGVETEGEYTPGAANVEDVGGRSHGASLVEAGTAAGETMTSFHPATTTTTPTYAPTSSTSPTSDLDHDNDSDLSGTPTPAVPYPTVTSPPRPWTTTGTARHHHLPWTASKYGPVGARPLHAYAAAYPAAAPAPTAIPAWAALHAHAVARRHHHGWPTAPAASAALPCRRPSAATAAAAAATAAGYAYPAPWSATHGVDAWAHDHARAADAWGNAAAGHDHDAWAHDDEAAAAAAAWAHAYATAAAASAWRAPMVPQRGHAEDDAAFDPFAPAPVEGVGQEDAVGEGESVAAEAP
ncbi:hypothetical protein GGF31_007897 [Allomyces arbusculus]|nr:hypothetical protein GGF31_007897 [Allomyces arbusculus]